MKIREGSIRLTKDQLFGTSVAVKAGTIIEKAELHRSITAGPDSPPIDWRFPVRGLPGMLCVELGEAEEV